MRSLVTIGIPTYTRFDYLQEATASALAQTYPNIELLISQNPAKGGIAGRIRTWSEALAASTPRVRYQCNPRNVGAAGNFNAIADAARGEYLFCLGDDDRIAPDFVEKLLPAMERGASVAFCNQYLTDAEGNRLEEESRQLTRRFGRDWMPHGEVEDPEIWAWQQSFPMAAALFRTDDFRRLRCREDLGPTCDLDYFIRVAREGGRFFFVPEYLAEYRTHPMQASARGFRWDIFLEKVLPMEVPPRVEPFKRRLISELIVSAVHSCLLEGEVEKARRLLDSPCYPPEEKRSPKGIAVGICALMPSTWGSDLFRLLHLLWRPAFHLHNVGINAIPE